MATNVRGPLSWWDDPPPGGGQQHKIGGSVTGRTIPEYMDPEGNYGELRILRLQGVNRDLPKRPFLIRKSVQSFVHGKIEGGFPEAGGKTYALKVRNPTHFNKLLEMKALSDGTPVQVVEHPGLNMTKCVVTCRDAIEDSETVLVEDLKEQGVKEVRRIMRREGEKKVNTPTLILTCKGTCAPREIDFGFIRCRTRPYYPAPMQCFNCWAFGHTKQRCRVTKPICGKCSGDHPILENMACSADAFCKRCNTNEHAISHRSCPDYRRENEIQRIKVDQGLSYPEARQIYNQNNGVRSFASVTSASLESTLANMTEKIEDLSKQLKEKDTMIAQLQQAVAASRQKDIVISQLQEALKNSSLAGMPEVAEVAADVQFSTASTFVTPRQMETCMENFAKPIMAMLLQSQKESAEARNLIHNLTKPATKPIQQAEVSGQVSKKSNKKRRKESNPPIQNQSPEAECAAPTIEDITDHTVDRSDVTPVTKTGNSSPQILSNNGKSAVQNSNLDSSPVGKNAAESERELVDGSLNISASEVEDDATLSDDSPNTKKPDTPHPVFPEDLITLSPRTTKRTFANVSPPLQSLPPDPAPKIQRQLSSVTK